MTPKDAELEISLEPARWFLRIMAGIGAVLGLILVFFGIKLIVPSFGTSDLGPVELILLLAGFGLVAWLASRWAAGPPLRLQQQGDQLRLQRARTGALVCQAPVKDVMAEAVRSRPGTRGFPALEIRFPGRRPLILATLTPQPRLDQPRVVGGPTHLVSSFAFVDLVNLLRPEAWRPHNG